jgi:hypothetical protein
MTRNPKTPALLPGLASTPDPGTALNDWLEWQASLFGTGLGQLITLQQGLWSAWVAQVTALMLPSPSPQASDTGGALPSAAPWMGLPLAAMPPLAAWWSADSPFWQRGTEQLG